MNSQTIGYIDEDTGRLYKNDLYEELVDDKEKIIEAAREICQLIPVLDQEYKQKCMPQSQQASQKSKEQISVENYLKKKKEFGDPDPYFMTKFGRTSIRKDGSSLKKVFPEPELKTPEESLLPKSGDPLKSEELSNSFNKNR